MDGLDDFINKIRLNKIAERIRYYINKIRLNKNYEHIKHFIYDFDDRKKIISLFVIVVGLLSIFYNHDMNQKNDLIRDFGSDYDYLYHNYLALNESYYNLLSNKVILEYYYNDALNMYEFIYDNYSDVLDINKELMKDYVALNSILSNSSEKYSELQILYNQLSYEYDDLVIKLESQTNFSLSEVINDDVHLSLDPEEFIIYTYNLSSPGYFEVLFSSSVDIFIWVGSSGSDPSYYTRYPYYPDTAFEGRFVVPVVGNEIYLYFENTSEEIVANIEFSSIFIH